MQYNISKCFARSLNELLLSSVQNNINHLHLRDEVPPKYVFLIKKTAEISALELREHTI